MPLGSASPDGHAPFRPMPSAMTPADMDGPVSPRPGRIDVRAALNGELVEVSVADTGVGIAPEDQEAVFEEFRQVGTAGNKVEGTGLGLALSRKFIELHGGRICAKSQVGMGSTFTFTLPVRREPSDRGGAATLIS
jgi:signal transduction histidine kinase